MPWLITSLVLVLITYTVYAAEWWCEGREPGAYALPPDCSQYVVCQGAGLGYSQFSCPPGLLYDDRTKVCDFSHQVTCNGNEGYGGDPADKKPEVDLSKQDDYSHENNVLGAVRDCSQDGLYQDPRDCSIYYRCALGRRFTQKCPPGTSYNPNYQVCLAGENNCGIPIRSDENPHHRPPAQNGPENRPAPPRDNDRNPHHIHVEENNRREESVQDNKRQEEGVPNDRGDNPHLNPSTPNRPSNIASTIKASFDDIMKEATRRALEILQSEADSAKSMPRYATSRPFHRVQSFMGSNSFVKQMSVSALVEIQLLKICQERFQLTKDQIWSILRELGGILRRNTGLVEPDSENRADRMDTCPYPDNSERNRCNPNAKYRTHDGTCNNLKRPLWGKSFRPLVRYLSPDYADGIEAPRVASDGSELPSARLVSRLSFPERDSPDHVHTILHMSWGQFLDHDMSRTAMSQLNTDPMGNGRTVNIECGADGCRTEGIENRQCLPIPVPMGDTAFQDRKCLMFVRSQEVPPGDCQSNAREQLNQLTSHLDASMIYGNTKQECEALRDLANSARGRLKVTPNPSRRYRELLPQKEGNGCRDLNTTVRCFLAGDTRVNEQVGLISVHTIYHRYHNVIEEKLHRLNPKWDGDTLFQETKKIVTAAWQHQVYNEYLPLVLGTQKMQEYGLRLHIYGYWDGYDPSVNTEISNVFATAAFRFAHSTIQNDIVFRGLGYDRTERTQLSNIFNRPLEAYNTRRPAGSGIDSVLLGQLSQPMQNVDSYFSKEVTNRLFSADPPNGPGTDLASLNIQRGRDHGVPGYTAWRKWCGLSVPHSFNEISDIPADVVRNFVKLYKNVDDIDLYPAGIAERHVPGGVVGPTFACIIGRQFRALRVGDRFWYERPDRRIAFTPDQLIEIRKSSIARVVCDSSDNIDTIQPYALLQPISEAFKNIGGRKYREIYNLASLYRGENNERRSCDRIPDIDLSKWKA